jgi:hypothetical protein
MDKKFLDFIFEWYNIISFILILSLLSVAFIIAHDLFSAWLCTACMIILVICYLLYKVQGNKL